MNLNWLFWAGSSLLLVAGGCRNSPKSDCIDPAKIKPDALCIEVYEPVCGCDGKTYPNSCNAMNAGLTSYTKGECR